MENIIKSCFQNPRRRQFPFFLKSKLWDARLCEEELTCDFLLERLKQELPKSLLEFNARKIFLKDTNNFYMYVNDDSTSRELVNKELYTTYLKASRWHGPYLWNGMDWFLFASANESGDNEYFLLLSIYLEPLKPGRLVLSYQRNSSRISPNVQFSEKDG